MTFPTVTYVDYSAPPIAAAWLNAVNTICVTWDGVFGSSTTAAQMRTALGATATGDSLFTAASAAAARSALSSAASGAATASGLTTATGKLLGRTTAGTGALEELDPGSGLSFTAGALNVDITELTEDTSPDASADYVMTYDASATANKKVKPINLMPFTKSYVSADQTITTAGALTLAHSLGAVPTLLKFFLVCQTGELNYSAGDVIVVDTQIDPTNAVGRGISAKIDSTNITIRYGSTANVFMGLNATTGNIAPLTNANWKFRVRAWV